MIEKENIKMAENERFEITYHQKTDASGWCSNVEIWVDKKTGVNYLAYHVGQGGGLTPLLDKDGKPIVTPKNN